MSGVHTLDQLDDLDRRIIAALQTDGRASWTAIAQLADTSVPTVARRAQQFFAQGIVRVAVMASEGHGGPVDLFFLRIGCEPGMSTRVATELVQRDDIRFLAVVTGSADIIAELSKSKDDFLYPRIIDEVQAIDGVVRCETDMSLHTYKVAYDWSRQLLTGEEYVYDATEAHECDPGHFDQTDRAILGLLRHDGRASFRAVADALDVNESTVRRRFDALRSRGCASVATLVPAPALGFESEILLSVRVAPASLDRAARELASYRGVRYVAAMLNGSSLMCELILPTTRDVFDFVTNTLARLDGVQEWTANMELLTLKRGYVETPWWRSHLAAPVRTAPAHGSAAG